ncbi:MAG TPA: ABC transporter ATP-binding protein [Ignavibacteria bacterium]|nr:ABC transporter ATP-binding protein [Ignavibacteria bacterium]
MIQLICDKISKDFDRKNVFKNVSFDLKTSQSLAITGKNGSGKSTLIKIIANFINPTSGSYKISQNGYGLPQNKLYKATGLIAPYLNLYDELTGYENLLFFYNLKTGVNKLNPQKKSIINKYLEELNLSNAKDEQVKNYSSGMRQRLKFAFAIMNDPELLLLDEPTSNLDNEGRDIFFNIIQNRKKNCLILLATNDDEEKKLCDASLNIEDYK